MEDTDKKRQHERYLQLPKSQGTSWLGKYSLASAALTTPPGEKLTDSTSIAESWREYCEELYSEDNTKDIK